MGRRLLSFWDGIFKGAILNFRWVIIYLILIECFWQFSCDVLFCKLLDSKSLPADLWKGLFQVCFLFFAGGMGIPNLHMNDRYFWWTLYLKPCVFPAWNNHPIWFDMEEWKGQRMSKVGSKDVKGIKLNSLFPIFDYWFQALPRSRQIVVTPNGGSVGSGNPPQNAGNIHV